MSDQKYCSFFTDVFAFLPWIETVIKIASGTGKSENSGKSGEVTTSGESGKSEAKLRLATKGKSVKEKTRKKKSKKTEPE